MPPVRKPILCYVTDRRAAVAGDERERAPGGQFSANSLNFVRSAIQNAAAAGVDWIQIREKDLAGHSLVDFTRLVIKDTVSLVNRIVINDRLDVALAANAAGIHLGENSLPLDAVAQWRHRCGRTDFQIGVSCHSLEAVRLASRGGADYVFFGPVFATPSKAAFGTPQGIEQLREVCAAVEIPVLAIGGVTFENARTCLEAGAAGIAAIRLFQDATDTDRLAASVQSLVQAIG
ncbi:MAG TPA: thiamine phosphate synthase [Candidatus Acidoferrales bacterium]